MKSIFPTQLRENGLLPFRMLEVLQLFIEIRNAREQLTINLEKN